MREWRSLIPTKVLYIYYYMYYMYDRVIAQLSVIIGDSEALGKNTHLVEADETAISGKRKYEKGRGRKRDGKTVWAQTVLEVTENAMGQRKAKRLRAFVVDQRDAATLHANILGTVDPSANVQTDSWASYRGLDNHDAVNHKMGQYVTYVCDRKVTTNTIEETHSGLKRQGREMNIFNGRAAASIYGIH